jgi:mono/diheme cytochrome c family protein
MQFHTRRALIAAPVGALLVVAVGKGQEPDEVEKTGKQLYSFHCAGCHNENGDGKGQTILSLGLEARDFKQGGFAFGDSREQMARTINSGIPGRSPMPSFKGLLSDDEIERIIDHVRTLMPPRKDEAPKNTEMIVRDRAVIARGKLPPIGDGAKEVPRGLLIGTPEGMTFEYDVEDVRLLGVRLGRFADREDWSDRGGAYLRPLGSLVHLAPPRSGEFQLLRSSGAPTKRRLRSTSGTRLSYDVVDERGRVLAAIEESLRVRLTSRGPAFTRSWKGALDRQGDAVELNLTGERRSRTWVGPLGSGWWVSRSEEAGAECVLLHERARFPLPEQAEESGSFAIGSTGTLEVSATYLQLSDWTPQLAAQIEKELGQ